MLSEKQKMLAGQLYTASDLEIQQDQARAQAWMERYNHSLGMTSEQRFEMLLERFAAVGPGQPDQATFSL